MVIPFSTALKIAEERTVPEIWAKADSAHEADLAVVQLGGIFKRELGIDQSAPSPVPSEDSGAGDVAGQEPGENIPNAHKDLDPG